MWISSNTHTHRDRLGAGRTRCGKWEDEKDECTYLVESAMKVCGASGWKVCCVSGKYQGASRGGELWKPTGRRFLVGVCVYMCVRAHGITNRWWAAFKLEPLLLCHRYFSHSFRVDVFMQTNVYYEDEDRKNPFFCVCVAFWASSAWFLLVLHLTGAVHLVGSSVVVVVVRNGAVL